MAVLEHRSDQGNVYSRLLAVVSLAVQYHGDQSKDWVLSIDCLAKVTQLFRSRFDWVKIGNEKNDKEHCLDARLIHFVDLH